MSTLDDAASSPCVGLCKMQNYGSQQLCSACLRTLDEIMQWRSMAEPERLRIMAALPVRSAGRSAAQTGDQSSA